MVNITTGYLPSNKFQLVKTGSYYSESPQAFTFWDLEFIILPVPEAALLCAECLDWIFCLRAVSNFQSKVGG